MNEVLIRAEGLKKYFKTYAGLLHAVDNVSLEIPRGRTLGVVGESGCGKSTLGRLLLRLIEPTGGRVFFKDENILEYDRRRMIDMRRQMQIIFQDPYSSLNPRLSVSELIAEPLSIHRAYATRAERNDRINHLMEIVGLADRLVNAYPHELDGGRRQRVGIARALALNPEFIVCDEPVSALDVSIQAQILNLMMDLQEELGLTFLFITHDLSVVKHISQDIMVMYLGQCIEKAPSEELFANPLHPYTRALLASIPVPNFKARQMKTEPIKGEISSPVNPAPGCRFAPRCPLARPVCREEVVFREWSPGHFCACALLDKTS